MMRLEKMNLLNNHENDHGVQEKTSEMEGAFRDQLIRLSSKLVQSQAFKIGLIVGPSAREKVDISQIYSLLRDLQQASKKTASPTLYYLSRKEVNMQSAFIPSLKLFCYDINAYFDFLFRGYSLLTAATPKEAQRVLHDLVAVMIFSNDALEIERISNEIEGFLDGKTSPLIFIGATAELEMSTLGKNVRGVYSCDFIDSKEKSMIFWQTVREQLDGFANEVAEYHAKHKKSCVLI